MGDLTQSDLALIGKTLSVCSGIEQTDLHRTITYRLEN